MISFLSFEVIQQDLGFVISMLMFDWLLIKPFYIFFSLLLYPVVHLDCIMQQ